MSHLGLAFVLMLRPFFHEIVMSTDVLSFEHPSVLLFCFRNGRQVHRVGCHHIYFCYIIFIIYALRVTIFMTSPLGVAVGLLSI